MWEGIHILNIWALPTWIAFALSESRAGGLFCFHRDACRCLRTCLQARRFIDCVLKTEVCMSKSSYAICIHIVINPVLPFASSKCIFKQPRNHAKNLLQIHSVPVLNLEMTWRQNVCYLKLLNNIKWIWYCPQRKKWNSTRLFIFNWLV